MIVEGQPHVLEYLPDLVGKKKYYPEREFFWTVVYSTCHDLVEKYIKSVYAKRLEEANLQDKQTTLVIADEYMDELLKYEYESKKKGRNPSSLLIKDMVKA